MPRKITIAQARGIARTIQDQAEKRRADHAEAEARRTQDEQGHCAEATGYPAGARVRVNIPGHRWHGLTGVTKFGGSGSHYIVCDSGREIAPLRTDELLPDNVQSEPRPDDALTQSQPKTGNQ